MQFYRLIHWFNQRSDDNKHNMPMISSGQLLKDYLMGSSHRPNILSQAMLSQTFLVPKKGSMWNDVKPTFSPQKSYLDSSITTTKSEESNKTIVSVKMTFVKMTHANKNKYLQICSPHQTIPRFHSHRFLCQLQIWTTPWCGTSKAATHKKRACNWRSSSTYYSPLWR